MASEWDKKTEDDLREEANKGFQGQGAIAELLRRSGKGQLAIKKLTVAILILTILLLIAAVCAIYLQRELLTRQRDQGMEPTEIEAPSKTVNSNPEEKGRTERRQP